MSALAKSLLEFQKNAPQIRTDSKGNFNNSYVSLPALMDALRTSLAEHGLMLIQKPTVLEDGHPGLITVLLHESGENEMAVMPLMLDKQNPQGLGSAITYARRQAALAFLGLAADDDDDGSSASAKPTPSVRRPDPPVGAAVSGGASAIPPDPAPAAESGFKVPEKAREGALGFEESSAANVSQEQRNREAASRVKVHFGKNVDKTLGELTQKQVQWYAGDGWLETTSKALEEGKKQKVTSKDLQLRQAARCYLAVEPIFETAGAFAPDADVPF